MLKKEICLSSTKSSQIINISSFILTEISCISLLFYLEGAKNQNSVIYSNQYMMFFLVQC